jgi:hypothetical protein
MMAPKRPMTNAAELAMVLGAEFPDGELVLVATVAAAVLEPVVDVTEPAPVVDARDEVNDIELKVVFRDMAVPVPILAVVSPVTTAGALVVEFAARVELV